MCKTLPRAERRQCRREQSRTLQKSWLKELAQAGPQAKQAWQTQLWLSIFPINWKQIGSPALLNQTIETIRLNTEGNYGNMLEAMLHDAALLISLNGPANHRKNPNENLARETLELFSLGEGNYSENDVRETARALTGYQLNSDQNVILNQRRHDQTPKKILGRKHNFEAKSLAYWLAEQPETSRFIAKRIWHTCIGTTPEHSQLESLSRSWRKNNLSLPWLMNRISNSQAALQSKESGLRLIDPIELIARTLQLLGTDHPDAIAISIKGLRAMGQAPFEPPSVKGWPINEEWLNLRWLQARRRTLQQLLADEEIWSSHHLPSELNADLTSIPPLTLSLPITTNRERVSDLFSDPAWQVGLHPAIS